MYRALTTGAFFTCQEVETMYNKTLDFDDDGSPDYEEYRPSAALKLNSYSSWVDGFNKYLKKNFKDVQSK